MGLVVALMAYFTPGHLANVFAPMEEAH